jgi:hypothetical protein
MANLSFKIKDSTSKAENLIKKISENLGPPLDESANKYSQVFNDNEAICFKNLNSIDEETQKIYNLYDKADKIIENVLQQQKTLINELNKIKSSSVRLNSNYSSETLGSIDDRETLNLKARVSSRYLSDSYKILNRPNPIRSFSNQETQEENLNEIERKLVIFNQLLLNLELDVIIKFNTQ